jgi:hypothetical protein
MYVAFGEIPMRKMVEKGQLKGYFKVLHPLFSTSFLSRPVSPLGGGPSLPVGPSLPDFRKRIF